MVGRIDEAMRIDRAFNAGVHTIERGFFADHDYVDPLLEVGRIDHESFGSIFYGVHFRTTNEFCVFCQGVGDGPSLKSDYRTDRKVSTRDCISTF